MDEEEEGEDAARVAWPKTLSQYGASWASRFDGGLTTITSSTVLAVSLASSAPTSFDSEDRMVVRRPYAAFGRYGLESFGREQRGALRLQERERDEWGEYPKKVEYCREDLTLVQGHFVAGEGRNECCKVGRGRWSWSSR